MEDIFISYSRRDLPVAQRLAEALQQSGLSVWWDRKLQGGEYFDDVIERAIKNARCVVVLWSATSVDSRFVKDEATLALDLGKLVPVAIDTIEAPLRFRNLQTISLVDWNGSKTATEFAALRLSVERHQAPGSLIDLRARPGRRTFALAWHPGPQAKTEPARPQATRSGNRAVAALQDRAERGDGEAQIALAKRLFDGAGVPVDSAEGVRWLRIAAEADAEAMYELGRRLCRGLGVKSDPEEGRRLLHEAAARGHQAALGELTRAPWL